MEKLFLIIIATATLTACVNIKKVDQYQPPSQEQIHAVLPEGVKCTLFGGHNKPKLSQRLVLRKEIISPETTLVEGAGIMCDPFTKYGEVYASELVRYEYGKYKDKLFRFWYSDGSGLFQGDEANVLDTMQDLGRENWSIECKVDPMDDSYWCQLSKKSLVVIRDKKNIITVRVGTDHVPDTGVMVRVGSNEPIASSDKYFTIKQSEEIIKQFKSQKSAVTRFQRWPYRGYIDTKLNLYGFKEAWELTNLIYENIKI